MRNQSQQKFLRDTDVAARFGVARVTVWRWSRETDFPAPIRLPGRCTRWSIWEIEKWEQKVNKDPQESGS